MLSICGTLRKRLRTCVHLDTGIRACRAGEGSLFVLEHVHAQIGADADRRIKLTHQGARTSEEGMQKRRRGSGARVRVPGEGGGGRERPGTSLEGSG